MDSYKIKDILERVNKKEILLPSIQRKFVWGEDKIINLFDSIMRGYPFGTFLFWHIEEKNEIQEYKFYEFIRNYSLKNKTINEKAEPSGDSQIDVVMDGQQRITSLYIGIYGSFETKPKWAKGNKPENWQKKHLYFQPNVEERTDDDTSYRFVFLKDADADDWNKKKEDRYKYYRVHDFKNCTAKELRDKLHVGQIRTTEEDWRYNLEMFRRSINDLEIIPVHTIQNRKLSDVLEIFTRINNGGTPLSPSNLLFSTVITSWEEGREEMDSLIESINKEGIIYLREDFLIRACLYLLNEPISAKIGILKKSIVEKIKDNWEKLKTTIFKLKNYLIDHHIVDEGLISYNSLLPIAYYFYHTKKNNQQESEEQLFNYLVISQLFSLFGGSSDATLEKVRKGMCKDGALGDLLEPFRLSNLFEIDLSAGRAHAFKKTRSDIENIIDIISYGDKKTYALLCLLQPDVDLRKKKGNYYDIDHVCPRKELNKFIKWKRTDDPERIALSRDMNLISNLQLLDARINRGDKNDKTLYDWAITEEKEWSIPCNPYKGESDPERYRINSIEDFYKFYNKRRKLIIDTLCSKFGIE